LGGRRLPGLTQIVPLRNIFGKLGISSRASIAGALDADPACEDCLLSAQPLM
jgi:hypothetical protein